MELEEEVRLLRQMLQRARATLPELKAALVGQFAPKETPRPEVLVAVKLLASLAGLPARCPDIACRRAGLCAATDVCDPACAALWPDELNERLDDMVAGITLSALCLEQRNAAIHARVEELLPEAAVGRRKKRLR